jgi:cell division protein FtsW
VDPLLLTLQLLLGAFGVLGVATAAPTETFDQAVRFLAAFALTVVVARVPARVVVRFAPALYGLALALLVVVLFAGVAPETGDARRWLPIGPVTFQPSELMKVAVIAYLAAFFHNHLGDWQIWRPMLVVGIAAGLIVAQPNVSTALFLFVLAFAIMIAAGTSLQRLVAIGTAAAFIAVAIGAPYLSRLGYLSDRLQGFADALGGNPDVTGIGYQADRARQALARAGLFGVGPSRPRIVPAAETDMIAISIAQALGLVGVAVLVVAFVLLVARTFRIAGAARGPGALLAAGAGLYVAGQASLNLLVAAGLLPVTGVPLPLVSYGFNSAFSVSIALGFVHAAYREARARGAPL